MIKINFTKLALPFLLLIFLTGCFSKERKQMQQFAGLIEVQDSTLSAEKEKRGQALTDSIDALRGHSLEETENTGIIYHGEQKTWHWIFAIGMAVCVASLIVFNLIKGAKKRLKDLTYVKSKINSKTEEILNNPGIRTKMKEEDKRQLEDMMKIFDKK